MKYFLSIFLVIFLLLYGIYNSYSQNGLNGYEENDEDIANLSNGDCNIGKIRFWNEEILRLLHNDPVTALKFLDSTMVISQELNNDSLIAKGNILYGRLHAELLNLEIAIDYFYKALQYKSYLSKIQLAELLNLLGIVCGSSGNKELALKYYNSSYEIYDSLKNASGLCYLNINFGNIYYDKSEFEIALKYFLLALEFGEESGNRRCMAISCNNIGNIYGSLEQLEMALMYYQKGIDHASEIPDYNMYGVLKVNLGELYVIMGQVDKGISYIEEAKEISDRIGNKKMILSATKHLGKYYPLQNKHEKAYQNMKIYQKYYDSVFNEEMTQKIFQMNLKYEMEENVGEEEIIALQKEKKIKIQRVLYISGFAISIIILPFIFYYLRNRIKIQQSRHEMIKAYLETEGIKSKNIEDELSVKNNELEKFALLIIKTNEFIQEIKNKINRFKKMLNIPENISKLNDLYVFINQNTSLTKSRKEFQGYLNNYYTEFFHKVERNIKDLTEMEKHLIVLLRLNFSIKEIAAIFNISNESVAVYRSNLRKKIGLSKEDNICEYLSKI